MPFVDVPGRLEDILDAIADIQRFLSDRTFEDDLADVMLRQAVERSLEIISEASRHTPDDLESKHTTIPWQKVPDIDNIHRHAYPIIDHGRMWKIATDDLPVLEGIARQMLTEIEGRD